MSLDFDSFVIETYAELAAAVLVAMVLIVVLRRLFELVRGRMKTRVTATIRSQENPFVAPPVNAALGKELSRRRAAERREFDRLAGMIADVSARADHLTETQNKAALKLDSAEMAVRRVLTDIGGVMPVTSPSAREPLQVVTQAPALSATRSAA